MSAWVKTKELSGDDNLEYLREKYKDRNLLEELGWGAYNIHSGYLSKSDADFLNWLCNAAYREKRNWENSFQSSIGATDTAWTQTMLHHMAVVGMAQCATTALTIRMEGPVYER